MQRCSMCVMPDTVPGIDFDEKGLCPYCRNYRQESYRDREELDALVAEAKARERRYDAIVPVSGGRDSTYVLYYAKAVLDMRVLAVNYDNEFGIQESRDNIRRACDRLGVDLEIIRSRREIARRITRYNIRAATEFGQFRECAACTYGYRSVVYRKAMEYRAPLIFWGESKEEATGEMELRAFERVRKHSLKYLKLINPSFYLAEYYRLLQRLEFHVSLSNVFRRDFEPVFRSGETREIRLFDYLPWDRRKLKDVIMRELGWKIPEGSVSSWKTDCRLMAFTNYIYVRLFGCTKACFGYCRMINSGQMDRETALLQEEAMVAGYDAPMRDLLVKSIGLRPAEAERILRDAPLFP